MNIHFSKITYRNFLSSGDYDTIIQLDGKRSTLIVGHNGAGKSTFLDAICFGLFGKPYRNIKKPQLINSINNKDCRVTVEFSIGNSQYRVVRGMKPNIFEIYQNGVLINQESHNRDYQRVLELNILRLSFKSFNQIVVLGASNFVPFMQLPTQHRREVIEDLLDISIFTKMNIVLKESLSKQKDAITLVDHEYRMVSQRVSLKSAHIAELKSITAGQRSKLEEQISAISRDIQDHQTHIDNMRGLCDSSIPRATEGLGKAEAEYEKLIKLRGEFKGKLTRFAHERKFFSSGCACPTCTQPVSPETAGTKLVELSTSTEETTKILTQLEEAIALQQKRIGMFNARLQECGVLKTKIQGLEQAIRAARGSIEKLQKQIAETESAPNVAAAEAELIEIMAAQNDLSNRRSKLVEARMYDEVIGELLKDTGIKTKITQQYIPVINRLVNQYLQILDFYVSFNLDENFNETIKSRHRDEFTYASFSEGEKARIDLALLFTWRQIARMKNSTVTNLLVMDEVFDSSLDGDGVDNLLKILGTLGDETNVFVISHKQDMLDGKFAEKVEFAKIAEFSRVVSR